MDRVARVFVARATLDWEPVQRILELVTATQRGLEINTRIKHSSVWWTEARKEIDGCDAFIFCTTSAALRSKGCWAELSYARRTCKPLFHVVIESADEIPRPRLLRSLPPILIATDSPARGCEHLGAALAAQLSAG